MTARSADRALRMLDEFDPDLVIIDIDVLGSRGVGFLRKLQQQSNSGHVPILIHTARVATKGFFDSVDIGGFLAKPCTAEALLEKIKEILTRRETDSPERLKPPRTVLLVEDNYEVIDELQRAFRVSPRNLTLEIATTAAEAVEKAAMTSPDIVLTKEVLRGMNGDEMASLLRRMPGTHEIPVLLYDKTHLFESIREFRYHVYGRAQKFVGAPDGFSLHSAVCEILDSVTEPRPTRYSPVAA